jgi:hypothetical protein
MAIITDYLGMTLSIDDLDAENLAYFRYCEGFSDAGQRYALPTHWAGVGEATEHEVTLAQVVQRARVATRRALWGLGAAAGAGSARSAGRMRGRAVVRGAVSPTMEQPGSGWTRADKA